MGEYTVKSDYTLLRKRAQKLSNGNSVYESNLMTISPLDELFSSDQSVVPSDSNFKFSVRKNVNSKKKHARSSWDLNPSGEEGWKYGDVSGTSISEESTIKIKPDYTSIKDFAYYGSALSMIKAAVNDVILYFPAELYFSSDIAPAGEKAPSGKTSPSGETKYYLIHNGYGIDADTTYISESSVTNPMRYLCLSSGNYDIIEDSVEEGGKKKKVVTSGVSFNIEKITAGTCSDRINGAIIATATCENITFYTYQKGSEKYLIYSDDSQKGKSIRPCQEAIDNYFNSLDDFEDVLLNRDSYPLYKAKFRTPKESDTGVTYSMVDYIWPSYNNWNPDVDSVAFTRYINKLINLATFHDEYDSNVMWRMQTHESIKNLDWTFFSTSDDGMQDLSDIDSSRIEAMIQLYGRQFDGVKRYIDNVKHINNITYNGKQNIPDYHLTDVAELAGWEANLIIPNAQTCVYSDNGDGNAVCVDENGNTIATYGYGARTKGWNETEANIAFARNLKINSRYLNSIKGTRDGIETILGLCGLKPNEYDITEYVAIAEGSAGNDSCDDGYYAPFKLDGIDCCKDETGGKDCKYPLFRNVAAINMKKDTMNGSDSFGIQDFLQGLAVKVVNKYDDSGKIEYRYCVPWYDKTVEHDGDWYYQCKGGWGKQPDKKVSWSETSVTAITGSIFGFSLYDESEGYLKYAQDKDELTGFTTNEIYNGCICYVTDTSGMMDESGKTEDESHYYILNDVNNSTQVGKSGWTSNDVNNSTQVGKSGWTQIPMDAIRVASTAEAVKVIYLETLKEKTEGNNPHIGKGKYDDGSSYLDYMDFIFAGASGESALSLFTESDKKKIEEYKFNIKRNVADNKKCHYFADLRNNYTSKSGAEGAEGGKPDDKSGTLEKIKGVVVNNDYSGSEKMGTIEMDIDPISPIGEEKYAESAADSVINVKNLLITFKYPSQIPEGESFIGYTEWEAYITDVVAEYLKQMLPSTTIWEYKIEGTADNWEHGRCDESGTCGTNADRGTPDKENVPKPQPTLVGGKDGDTEAVPDNLNTFEVDGIIYGNEDYDGMDFIEFDDNITKQ